MFQRLFGDSLRREHESGLPPVDTEAPRMRHAPKRHFADKGRLHQVQRFKSGSGRHCFDHPDDQAPPFCGIFALRPQPRKHI